jgi:DNA-directed RNA polymerase subunit M/transcription elongation factor TFIIS
MVTIATYDDPAKAKHLKHRFQESGVRADAATEGQMQAAAAGADQLSHIRVKVEERDFAKAQSLMVEWEKSDPQIVAAIRCPQCGSPRIHYPQMARKFPFVTGLFGILLAMKIIPKEYYCEDCQHTWTKEPEPLPRKPDWETFS